MKKVCHVLSGFFRNDARIFEKQCKSLLKEGYEVCILTNDGLPDEIIDGIRIIACNSFYQERLKVIYKAKAIFKKSAIEIDADIYQLHGPELIPLGLALKRLGKKVFYDAHEDLQMQILEKESIPQILRLPISKLIKWYLKITLNKFDEIFSVTPHIVDSLKKISKSVTLITNYPIIEKSDILDYNNYKNRDNILCYSGTVYHNSNQEYILEGITNVKDLKYHIAGTLDNNYLLKLSGFISWSKVKFFGRLSKNELKLFYQSAIAGIIIFDYSPNLGYKTGTLGSNKLFEYMREGLPIICTDFDLWKEIVKKYDCGICVEPNNARHIEDAIIFLIKNKEKAYQMGQNGRKAVLEEYNWQTQEKKYIAIYKKYD